MPEQAAPPFAFGKNWSRYLASVTPDRIAAAEASVRFLIKQEDLHGKTFLDAGSGSGLFSLAAHRMGATVTSFDVDADSVACTEESKRRFTNDSVDASTWTILSGSLLDDAFIDGLLGDDSGRRDVVYCWGVAHHTGDMWKAIENLMRLVNAEGTLVLAIYNDQQYISRGWSFIKQVYQRLPRTLRPAWVAAIGLVEFAKRLAVTLAACWIRAMMLKNPMVPLLNWVNQTRGRGMNGWHDLVDWVGGWPFEVATPEAIFRFARDRGFVLEELITSAGHGCNEFTFVRRQDSEVSS